MKCPKSRKQVLSALTCKADVHLIELEHIFFTRFICRHRLITIQHVGNKSHFFTVGDKRVHSTIVVELKARKASRVSKSQAFAAV